MTSPPQYVSKAHAETLLQNLEKLPGDPAQGFFGPASITWQVNRECAVFFAAGRAALLQLAHPWVATALDHHSDLRNDAIGRFHSTFRVIYTMLFGTRNQALAASRQLYRRHTTIRGELPSAIGPFPAHQRYEANETAALLWVYATLVDSALLAYELVRSPLPRDQREAYFVESKRMAALFGLAPEALPADWNSFTRYMSGMLGSAALTVDATGRALGQSVLSGVGTWIRPPIWYRALTTFWLPAHLRADFGLPFGPREVRALQRAERWVPRLYCLLPRSLRLVGPYHEAISRLRGRAPGPLTRLSNHFWMGQQRLLYSGVRQPSPDVGTAFRDRSSGA